MKEEFNANKNQEFNFSSPRAFYESTMNKNKNQLTRVWSFKQLDDLNRKYAGNSGYMDVLGSSYHWNSRVGNYGKPRVSDFVIIIDNESVLGISRIDSIREVDAMVASYHCPNCMRSGSFKPRVSEKFANKFRCEKCFFEGNEPLQKFNDVKEFEAGYETYWRELNNFKVAENQDHFLAKSVMSSIRELDLAKVREIFENRFDLGAFYWGESYSALNISGGSKVVLMKQRIGQSKFRNHLLKKYGNTCAISGSSPAEILEAAHLYRYSAVEVHDPEGGLLFRSDLHTLFDRWLLTIDPSDLTIRISPKLLTYAELAKFEGQIIQIPRTLVPNLEYLKIHFDISVQSWK